MTKSIEPITHTNLQCLVNMWKLQISKRAQFCVVTNHNFSNTLNSTQQKLSISTTLS
jgi:hypothetical protein